MENQESMEIQQPAEAQQSIEIQQPVEIPTPMPMPEPLDVTPVKRACSRIGWALCAIIAALLVVQTLIGVVVGLLWPDGCWLTDSSTGMWLMTFVPQYLIAMPLGILLMRKVPAEAPQSVNMGIKNFWIFLPICFFLTYGGSIVGNLLSSVMSSGQAENALDQYALDTNPIKILFMVVLAPLFEEYIFRKQIIDRTRVHGEKAAVLLSALTFALFHMNLFQFFYAFLLGWVFGYIYVRTGKLRYPVLIHGIINLFGSVIAPMIMGMLDLDALASIDPNATEEELLALYSGMMPGLLLYFLYTMVLLGLCVVGLIFFAMRCRKLKWQRDPYFLTPKARTNAVYANSGMLVFLAVCILMTLLSVLVL